MIRLLGLTFVVLILIPQARADEDLAGTWKNTADFGVSYWELTPKKLGIYDAREYGLGSRVGTARLMDGHLIIEFEADGHRGVYDWHLKGLVGEGTYTQTSLEDGQAMRHKSTVRFIGR